MLYSLYQHLLLVTEKMVLDQNMTHKPSDMRSHILRCVFGHHIGKGKKVTYMGKVDGQSMLLFKALDKQHFTQTHQKLMFGGATTIGVAMK